MVVIKEILILINVNNVMFRAERAIISRDIPA